MNTRQQKYHLDRLAQNAAALGDLLQADAENTPAGADERPALIASYKATIREDVAALQPLLEGA
jgi:hypothetical protein